MLYMTNMSSVHLIFGRYYFYFILVFFIFEPFYENSYSTRACLIYIDYFMVGECVRFLFTSCEESQMNE